MIRVLIVGNGGMANDHAEAYAEMDGVQVVAGVDTDPDRLRAFCDKHTISNGCGYLSRAGVSPAGTNQLK